MQKDYYPVASRTRSYSSEDSAFIKTEVNRLPSDDIIEPSKSPWKAQLLVVRTREKCRLVVDYSQTVNRFTLLDAYSLPRIEDIVNRVGKDKYYSSRDLRSAHHQLPIRAEEHSPRLKLWALKPLSIQKTSLWCYKRCSRFSKSD